MTPSSRQPPLGQEGTIHAGPERVLSLSRVRAFSGGPLDSPDWPDANLHTCIEKARAAGLPGIIASGTQLEGMLISLLVSLCGPAWHRSGSLEVRFLRQVRVDDVIRPVLALRSKEPAGDGVRVSWDAWCERDRTERVLEGTASCLVGDRKG